MHPSLVTEFSIYCIILLDMLQYGNVLVNASVLKKRDSLFVVVIGVAALWLSCSKLCVLLAIRQKLVADCCNRPFVPRRAPTLFTC